MTLGFWGEKDNWVAKPAEGQHPAVPEPSPHDEYGGRQQAFVVAADEERADTAEVEAETAGPNAEATPDEGVGLLGLPGLEAGEFPSGAGGPAIGDAILEGGATSWTGQS